MRVALVHDYLNQYGGGERVLEALSNLFPEAPIYTLFYDKKRTGFAFEGKDIRTSFLQKIPFISRAHHLFPILMPLGIESFDLSSYDLVISSSASFAKGIITGPETLHICYCHTPTRYLWQDSSSYVEDTRYPRILKFWIPLATAYLRVWDRQAAKRPDFLFANSQFVQRRIAKYYGRKSKVIHPPVNFNFFARSKGGPGPPQDAYFLMVGRLVPYKRFDIAVRACTNLGVPLKIIGDGPERKYLERIAGPTIEFVGLVSERILPDYYRGAKALLFPQEEDFGITALEAMASGKPLIAYKGGGAVEIVEEGKTGIFFDKQTSESLAEAIGLYSSYVFDAQYIREAARGYGRENFLCNIREAIHGMIKSNGSHWH